MSYKEHSSADPKSADKRYRLSEAAEELKVSPAQLYNLLTRYELPHFPPEKLDAVGKRSTFDIRTVHVDALRAMLSMQKAGMKRDDAIHVLTDPDLREQTISNALSVVNALQAYENSLALVGSTEPSIEENLSALIFQFRSDGQDGQS